MELNGIGAAIGIVVDAAVTVAATPELIRPVGRHAARVGFAGGDAVPGTATISQMAVAGGVNHTNPTIIGEVGGRRAGAERKDVSAVAGKNQHAPIRCAREIALGPCIPIYPQGIRAVGGNSHLKGRAVGVKGPRLELINEHRGLFVGEVRRGAGSPAEPAIAFLQYG